MNQETGRHREDLFIHLNSLAANNRKKILKNLQ